MATSLKQVLGGSGAGFKLAPDLNYISSNFALGQGYKSVTVDPSGSLTTALSLTGKFAIGAAVFTSLGEDVFNIRLTIDGVVIIDDTVDANTSGGNTEAAIIGDTQGSTLTATMGAGLPVICEESFLLEIQSTTDTAVTLKYVARPVL